MFINSYYDWINDYTVLAAIVALIVCSLIPFTLLRRLLMTPIILFLILVPLVGFTYLIDVSDKRFVTQEYISQTITDEKLYHKGATIGFHKQMHVVENIPKNLAGRAVSNVYNKLIAHELYKNILYDKKAKKYNLPNNKTFRLNRILLVDEVSILATSVPYEVFELLDENNETYIIIEKDSFVAH